MGDGTVEGLGQGVEGAEAWGVGAVFDADEGDATGSGGVGQLLLGHARLFAEIADAVSHSGSATCRGGLGLLPVCGVAIVTGEVPGNIDRLAVRGAEDELVLAREFNVCELLSVDATDVVERDYSGASVGKGDLDSVRKDARGVYEE